MSIFREEEKNGRKGKYSSKRIIGILLITFFCIIVTVKIFYEVADISDTILGSILGGGLSSTISTIFKK